MDSCPTSERWQAHLDGALPAAEQALLTDHLEGCPSCQKTLDTLAAGGDSLLQVAQQVGAESSDPGATEGDLPPSSDGDRTQSEATAAARDDFPFLAPPLRRGSFGRLDHYEMLQVLGKGGFGTVFKAFDEKLHRIVAIKILAPELAASGTSKARFFREAKSAAAVKHDNVVAIYAVADESAIPPYLVMELIEGQTLQGKLDKTGALEVKEILRIGYQTACGLAAAHKQGLIHRDIKPGNILLENGVERVKITDFGLAKVADDASVTQSGVVAGTPLYMSPEQAEGLALDQRSDLFSLGTVLYVMCTGRPPFRASGTMAVLKRVCEDTPRPIREINPEIPQWLCDVVERLHAKKPEERFQSAKEVGEVLAGYLSEIQLHGGVAVSNVALSLRERTAPDGADEGTALAATSPIPDEPAKAIAAAAYRPWSTRRIRTVGAILGVVALAYLVLASRTQWFRDWMNHMVVGDRATVVVQWREPPGSTPFKVVMQQQAPPGKERLFKGEIHEIAGPNAKVPALPVTQKREDRKPGRVLKSLTMVPPGTYWLRIYRDDKEIHSQLVQVEGTKRQELMVPDLEAEPGWVQLFNGKDLTGWWPSTSWKVHDGILQSVPGTPPQGLVSRRADFANFHLRVEARLNHGGSGGILFRMPTVLPPVIYRAQIGLDQDPIKTGSLWHLGVDKAVKESLIKPDEWFIMEVIALDSDITIVVNDKTTTHWNDINRTHMNGSLWLQQCRDSTVLQFRKIEIKELPPEEAKVIARRERQADFHAIGLAYHAHYDKQRKAPAHAADLHPFLSEHPRGKRLLDNAGIVFIYKVNLGEIIAKASDYVLAHDATTPKTGGLVLMADGFVKEVTAAQFAALKLATPASDAAWSWSILDYRETHDVDRKGLESWLDQVKKDGWLPMTLSAWNASKGPRFAAIAAKPSQTVEWEVREQELVNPAAREAGVAMFKAMVERDFRPVARAVWIEGKSNFPTGLSLWVKQPSAGVWGMNSGNREYFEATMAKFREPADRKTPFSLSACQRGGSPFFNFVYRVGDRGPWATELDLTDQEIAKRLGGYRAKGMFPVDVAPYEQDGQQRFAALLGGNPKSVEWAVDVQLTAAEYEAKLTTQRAKGLRPMRVAGHERAGETRYAVIWSRFTMP